MTIQELIEVLDTFRDQYDQCPDPEVKKLCGFINNCIQSLEGYFRWFSHQKSRIDQSMIYYAEELEVLKQLLGEEELPDADVDPTPVVDPSVPPSIEDLSPSILDLVGE